MVAKNDITGNEIKSKILSSEGRDNYDRIFRKDKMRDKPIFVFIDDVRNPNEATLWGETPAVKLVVKSKIPEWQWVVVRSYDEFCKFIEENGIPDVVSFDNDLWDVATELNINPTNEELTKQFQMIGWQEFKIKTGAHCAEYLVKACKARRVPVPVYYIHTANSAARPIIKEILENASI
jgi:predicted RNA binding protein YcfA (HicA-like mRNA interferase family)